MDHEQIKEMKKEKAMENMERSLYEAAKDRCYAEGNSATLAKRATQAVMKAQETAKQRLIDQYASKGVDLSKQFR